MPDTSFLKPGESGERQLRFETGGPVEPGRKYLFVCSFEQTSDKVMTTLDFRPAYL